MTTDTALIKMPRRAAWPTLTLTVLALLAVVGVLLLTGSRVGAVARFGLRAGPSAISLTAGDSAAVGITVSAQHSLNTTVTLATTALPPGVRLELDRWTVPVSEAQPEVSVA